MHTPTAATPAHLGWQLAALLYDLFPLLGLWAACAFIAALLNGGAPAPGSLAAHALFAALLLVSAGYYLLSWRRGGQTIGMRAWRLRLVAPDGRSAAWPALLRRALLAPLSLGAFGLGHLWALLDAERRSMADLLSGTRVVRLPKT